MASTMNDKDWRSTMRSIRRKHSPEKSRREKDFGRGPNSARTMNLTCEDWSKYYHKPESVPEEKDELK